MRAKTEVCPACRRAGWVRLLGLDSAEGVNVGAWSCGHCRHAWRTEPWRISDPVKFFGDAQYTQLANEGRIAHAKIEIFERFLLWADELKPQPPRLMVDFGCSYGTCMQIFREHQWNVMGIEISSSAQKILNEQNLPWARCLEDSRLALGSVDIVVMSDCMYYLPEPVNTLQTIRSYMQPNSLLFLRQPTRGGLVRLLLKVDRKRALSRNIWLDHVHLFSRRSTVYVLERAGYCDVRFLREKDYRRPLKGEIIHRLLRATDFITFGFFDLTLSWIVIAKAG